MNPITVLSLEQRISRLENRNKALACLLVVILGWVAAMFWWSLPSASVVHANSDKAGTTLRVRQLIVVDERGIERVRIGAPLPDPVIEGKRSKRDDSIAGILIYDRDGDERGGYVTDNSAGNAFLTIDSKRQKQVTLVAYPAGGAEFDLKNEHKTEAILSATDKGPMLKLLDRKNVVLQQPAGPVK